MRISNLLVSLLLLASVAAPAVTALPFVPEPANEFYGDVHDATFDAAGTGQETAFGLADTAHPFAFGTATAAQAAAFAFAGEVHGDAFAAADNLQTSAFDIAGDAHGFSFARADEAHDAGFGAAADLHAAGFGLAGAAATAGFNVAGDAHGTTFDTAGTAHETGFNTAGDLLDGGFEGTETLRHGVDGLRPADLELPASWPGVTRAGNMHARPGPMQDMVDPYGSYFPTCGSNSQYRVVAFPQFAYRTRAVFTSQCTNIGAPVLQPSGSLVPNAPQSDCAATSVACFWFHVAPAGGSGQAELQFEINNNGGSSGFFYMVRLIIGNVAAIDFEVQPDDDLPTKVVTTFGAGSASNVVALVQNQWRLRTLNVDVTTGGEVPGIFAIHAHLGEQLSSQGYDVQFGRVLVDGRVIGAHGAGPYQARIGSSTTGGVTAVTVHLEQAGGQGGNHIVFGAGTGQSRTAAYTVDVGRPPPSLDLAISLESGRFSIDSATASSAMEFEFVSDQLGGGRVRATGVQDLRHLDVYHDGWLDGATTADVCDQQATAAYQRHDLWEMNLDQTCLWLASASPTTVIGYTTLDGGQVTLRDLVTAPDLGLTFGPGDYVGLRHRLGGSITVTVENLVAGAVSIERVVATDLKSFHYVGGTTGQGSTFEVEGQFGPNSRLQVGLVAPDIEIGADLQMLRSFHVSTNHGQDPLIVALEGNPRFTATSLKVLVDRGGDRYHFKTGSASLVEFFEFRARDRDDYCDKPTEWNCWPPIGVTVDLAQGGQIQLSGDFFVALPNFPDLDGQLKLRFSRDAGSPGKYHGRSEPSFTWCGDDDSESVDAGDWDRLAVCYTRVLDFYTRT